MAQYATAWHIVAQYGTVGRAMPHGMPQYNVCARYGTVWHTIGPYGTLWRGRAPYAAVWHTMASC